jgi:hypothetical protein
LQTLAVVAAYDLACFETVSQNPSKRQEEARLDPEALVQALGLKKLGVGASMTM